jgi:hypothetical protein
MSIKSLIDLLKQSVGLKKTSGVGVKCILPRSVNTEINISYKDLYELAFEEFALSGVWKLFSARSVVVLDFGNPYDNIIWFWTTVLCGGIPCACPSLSTNVDQRGLYIEDFQTRFEDPVFLTTKALHGDFAGNPNVHLGIVDQKHDDEQKTEVKIVERDRTMSSSQVNIVTPSDQVNIVTPSDQAKAEGIAVLMLTSGGTDRLKAVGITNR